MREKGKTPRQSEAPRADRYFLRIARLLGEAQMTDIRRREISLNRGARKAVALIASVRADGKKVMVIGNGGSAALASHAHNDLCKTSRVRALVFNEPPLLTAYANDCGYASVFEQPIEMWAETGDLLIAISSSGQSESILRAARAALRRQCRVITISGFAPDNPLRGMGHLNFYVASSAYGEVETAHAVILHFLTDASKA